jgi:hypothetical protein
MEPNILVARVLAEHSIAPAPAVVVEEVATEAESELEDQELHYKTWSRSWWREELH